jgi:hypothetical protein
MSLASMTLGLQPLSDRFVLVSPDPSGAHSWHPMAFNPQTGLVYVPVRDDTTFLHRPDASWRPQTSRRNNGSDVTYSGRYFSSGWPRRRLRDVLWPGTRSHRPRVGGSTCPS